MSAQFCTSCGEIHNGCCPSFEVRGSGQNGLARSYMAACAEINKLRADLEAAKADKATLQSVIDSMQTDLTKLRTNLEAAKNEERCPFCNEKDFDLIGLKHHLLSGHCDNFENTKPIERRK